VARAVASAAIPVAKEPQGFSRADGKRPNGLTIVPWREGKPLTWDVTVVCPFAESYIGDSAANAGSAAVAAAARKAAKYAVLETTHIFQPVAVENFGTMNASAYGFSARLGRKISAIYGDDRETSYLFSLRWFDHESITSKANNRMWFLKKLKQAGVSQKDLGPRL